MSNKTWWSTGKKNTRRSVIALIAMASTLAILSAIVWASPSSPIRQTVEAVVADAGVTLNPLSAENTKLKTKLASIEAKLAKTSSELTEQKKKLLAQQASTAKKLAEVQQQVSAANRRTAEAKAAASATKSKPTTTPPVKTPAVEPVITAPAKQDILNPASRYFGMYTEQAPFNWSTFDSTSSAIGVQPNLVGYFGGWDETFRANAVTRAWERGKVPLLTWESRPIKAGNDVIEEPDYSLPRILGDEAAGVPGAFDEYIHQYARDIVATGLPLGIRFNHEMNGIWYPWNETTGKGESINGNNPGDYVKVWKHVHDIFEAEGANELVFWVWSPNIINKLPAINKKPEFLASLYPGDDYVDMVGLSGYLRPAYVAKQEFTFEYTFDASLNQLRALTDKPILLAEVGASETGGHKETWLTSFFSSMAKPENDDIVGFAWFNLAITTFVEGERTTNDWRINSRADSLSAFITGLTDPLGRFTLLPAS
ncbi:glycosyl hydrolase [Leifsonia sp. A12D58]|uniref:glycosyl hydrolase n=1 Tax=Leifsonia sp. A12D58 TaxID=3397674 RepID=UPI0039E18DEA